MSEAPPSLHPDQPPAVRLMNTIWADRGELHDSLATTTMARAWAREAEISGAGRMSAEQVARLRRLRDGLRRVAADVTGDDRSAAVRADLTPEEALAAVNELLVPRRPSLAQAPEGGLTLRWTSEVDGFAERLATLALEGAEILSGAAEVSACHGPGCVLYFVKNHPKRGWCSAGCGNRARVARHYRRHRDSATS